MQQCDAASVEAWAAFVGDGVRRLCADHAHRRLQADGSWHVQSGERAYGGALAGRQDEPTCTQQEESSCCQVKVASRARATSPMSARPGTPTHIYTCSHCSRSLGAASDRGKWLACSRCQACLYCSADCQREHWRTRHHLECSPTPLRSASTVMCCLCASRCLPSRNGKFLACSACKFPVCSSTCQVCCLGRASRLSSPRLSPSRLSSPRGFHRLHLVSHPLSSYPRLVVSCCRRAWYAAASRPRATAPFPRSLSAQCDYERRNTLSRTRQSAHCRRDHGVSAEGGLEARASREVQQADKPMEQADPAACAAGEQALHPPHDALDCTCVDLWVLWQDRA